MRHDLAGRRWVVCAEGEFGDSVVSDLADAGVRVERFDPAGPDPDLSGEVAFIAGTGNDTVNIAMAERARQANPMSTWCCCSRPTPKPLLETLRIDAVHIATELIAREVLAAS